MGGVKAAGTIQKSCHYCGEPAKTRDHIVPKSRAIVCGAHGNIVPACGPCNNKKSDWRSDCGCMTCLMAWVLYGPPGWRSLKIVPLVTLPDAIKIAA